MAAFPEDDLALILRDEFATIGDFAIGLGSGIAAAEPPGRLELERQFALPEQRAIERKLAEEALKREFPALTQAVWFKRSGLRQGRTGAPPTGGKTQGMEYEIALKILEDDDEPAVTENDYRSMTSRLRDLDKLPAYWQNEADVLRAAIARYVFPVAPAVEQKQREPAPAAVPRAAPDPREEQAPKRKRESEPDDEEDADTESDVEEEAPKRRREAAESSSEEEEGGEKPVLSGKDGETVFYKGHWWAWNGRADPKGWVHSDPPGPDPRQAMRNRWMSLLQTWGGGDGKEGETKWLPNKKKGGMEFIFHDGEWLPKNFGIRAEFDIRLGILPAPADLALVRASLKQKNKVGRIGAKDIIAELKNKTTAGGKVFKTKIHWIQDRQKWQVDDPDIRQALLAESDE